MFAPAVMRVQMIDMVVFDVVPVFCNSPWRTLR